MTVLHFIRDAHCLPQPFDESYTWNNNSNTVKFYNTELSFLNPYKGGVFQQATSGVTETSA